MKNRFGLPVWALLVAIPVAFLATTATADNAVADQTETVANADVDATEASELSLDDGATDNYRRWWGRGFYGRGYRGYYGLGYGLGYGSWYTPYYGYGYGYPWYSSYWY